MVARVPIVRAKIPYTAVNRVRSLKFGAQLEALAAPAMGPAFRKWLMSVAKDISVDYPRRSGRSAQAIPSSPRIVESQYFDKIEGYFFVNPEVAANEYGALIKPRNAKMLAVPILHGLYPDGRPKRLGPNSWRSMNTFVYKSKRTGKAYIAYRSKTEGLKILYVLVDQVKVPEMRRFRSTYDRRLPELIMAFSYIMMNAIATVYDQQFLDAVNSIDPKFNMRKVPKVIPSAELHGERLVPKYR